MTVDRTIRHPSDITQAAKGAPQCKPEMKNPAVVIPDATTAIGALNEAIKQGGVPPRTLDLVLPSGWETSSPTHTRRAFPARAARSGRTISYRPFLQRLRQDRFFALWVLEATSRMRCCERAGARRDLLDLGAGTLEIEATRVVVDGKVIESDLWRLAEEHRLCLHHAQGKSRWPPHRVTTAARGRRSGARRAVGRPGRTPRRGRSRCAIPRQSPARRPPPGG
jgi:hypothetical protein